MFSTKCTYCRSLISLKNEDLETAVTQAEAEHQTLYSVHCPKCQRINKIQIKELKRRLPPKPAATPTDAPPTEPETTPSDPTSV